MNSLYNKALSPKTSSNSSSGLVQSTSIVCTGVLCSIPSFRIKRQRTFPYIFIRITKSYFGCNKFFRDIREKLDISNPAQRNAFKIKVTNNPIPVCLRGTGIGMRRSIHFFRNSLFSINPNGRWLSPFHYQTDTCTSPLLRYTYSLCVQCFPFKYIFFRKGCSLNKAISDKLDGLVTDDLNLLESKKQ